MMRHTTHRAARTTLAALTTIIALTLSAATAHADLIDPAEAACQNRAPGVACETWGGDAGFCYASTCTRYEYDPVQRTRHPVPYPCVICRPGAEYDPAWTPATTTSTSADASTSTATAQAAACARRDGHHTPLLPVGLAILGAGLLFALRPPRQTTPA